MKHFITFLLFPFLAAAQPEFNFLAYVMRNSGKQMIARFEQLLQYVDKKGWKTSLYKQLTIEN